MCSYKFQPHQDICLQPYGCSIHHQLYPISYPKPYKIHEYNFIVTESLQQNYIPYLKVQIVLFFTITSQFWIDILDQIITLSVCIFIFKSIQFFMINGYQFLDLLPEKVELKKIFTTFDFSFCILSQLPFRISKKSFASIVKMLAYIYF